MFAIQCSYLFRRILLEEFLRRDTLSGRGPHVSDVKILDSVIVIIAPADSHARAHILNAGLRSDVGKSSVVVVAVEVLPPEVVHDIKIGPAVAVVVVPTTAKTVTSIVLVKACLRGDIAEGPVPIVAHHEVGRTVLSIIVRGGVFVLVRALVIEVEAEVDVQPAVAIVVGHGGTREGPLRRGGKLKRLSLPAELATTFIQK